MTDLPEPLTPVDCDLRGLKFMPLDVQMVRDSTLTAKAGPDAFRAAVILWCAAWTQVPAASLPDDDEELAHLCGYGFAPKEWKKIRTWALHKFVKCSDGRLYHPIIAKEALDAWPRRQAHQEATTGEKTRKEREREERKRMFAELAEIGVNLPWNTKTGELRDRHKAANLSREPVTTGHAESVTSHGLVTPPVTAKTGTGTGTGTVPPTPRQVTPPLAERLRRVMEEGRFTSPPNDGALIDEWIRLGADFEQDILPVVRRVSQRLLDGGRGPFKLKVFDQEVREKIVEDAAYTDETRRSISRIERMDREQREADERRKLEDANWQREHGGAAA